MSVTITCYGGVNEIGGNKILLEDGDCRLFLDFGIAFGRQQQFFNEYLRPRVARGLLDLLLLGLIPPLEGLYRDDLAPPGLWERLRSHPHHRDLRRGLDCPAVDAILVSHAHLDHNGDLSYVDPRIPVYTHPVTAFIARAMQVTGQSGFERELTFISPRSPSASGELQADRKGSYQGRAHAFLAGGLSESAQEFWAQATATTKALQPAPAEAAMEAIAGLPIRWWPVDHSVPGAAGFAVQTSAGWIGYTGDLRFHGRQGERSRQFALQLAALRPVALLCEGTHTGAEEPLTEADVVANALALAEGAAGRLVVADFAPRNVERLFSFLEVARQTGRTLLIQPKDLYLLQAIALADAAAFPDPAALPGLALYADPKAAPRPWERALRQQWAGRTVKAADVSHDPGAYVLAFSLWDANDLLDLEGVAGGIYLYSNSRAYDEEQAADLERLRNWVRLMGLTMYGDPDDPQTVPLHASGHAPGQALAEFVQTVRPGMLIPVHTENPGWWERQLAGTGIAVRPPLLATGMAIS
ncbi:MAG: exonuclease [Anaerolineae bacterium]|nr:exonuclease [Anaerolineae bacterium]